MPKSLTCAHRPCGRQFEARSSAKRYCSDRCRQNARRARERDYDEAVDELQREGGTERTAVVDDQLLHELLWVSHSGWPDNPTEQDLRAGFALVVSDYLSIVADSEIPALFRRGVRTDKLRRRVQDRAARRALRRIDEYRCHVDLDELDREP